ncbi:MAG: hypothetical protein ACXWNJ_16660 [Vulcanimicrobiaceae bacterium]
MENSARILHGDRKSKVRVANTKDVEEIAPGAVTRVTVFDGYVPKKRYVLKDGTERALWACGVVLTGEHGRRVGRKTFSAPTAREVKTKRDAYRAQLREDERRAEESHLRSTRDHSKLDAYLDRWLSEQQMDS